MSSSWLVFTDRTLQRSNFKSQLYLTPSSPLRALPSPWVVSLSLSPRQFRFLTASRRTRKGRNHHTKAPRVTPFLFQVQSKMSSKKSAVKHTSIAVCYNWRVSFLMGARQEGLISFPFVTYIVLRNCNSSSKWPCYHPQTFYFVFFSFAMCSWKHPMINLS